MKFIPLPTDGRVFGELWFPSTWPMWLARHDNLPLGCLAPHLNRILQRPGGVESTDLGRQTVVTLWFFAFALGSIGLCAWIVLKGLL